MIMIVLFIVYCQLLFSVRTITLARTCYVAGRYFFAGITLPSDGSQAVQRRGAFVEVEARMM